ncbi:unnamed protein product [Psylliodes chrysocephalus]|uniref:Fanconi anemia group I protein n=1 Tax=Psylliodes chrysocephalus TaxID=3402493 RepID=A0A9P0CQT2_9CUCU|nr:unnamed protein product [Psylliodes chrysocephala]
MNSIIANFYQFGQKRDQKSLEKLMNSLEEGELLNIVKQELCSSKFTETWSYILKSFSDAPENHKKRLKLVIQLLKEFEERDIPQSRIDTIINHLNLELPKFKSSDLAKICSTCLDQIQSKVVIKFVWKDLLPEVLNVLIDRDTFTYEELDFTGAEYKSDFINTICMSSWSPRIVTSLTTFFIDTPLNKDEHLKVVTKLGTYIEKLTPQEIPSFVYQLLRLCKQQNGRLIFMKLQNYFGTRIYNNANIGTEDSPDTNSTVLDLIETTDNSDSIEAESNVLFHIHTAASLGYESIKEYLNSLKNILKAPEFILHPFQLMVLFTLSTIPHYDETVFDIIRPCIVRTYNEELKKAHSSWFREMVPTAKKPEEIISQVIHFSLPDRDLVLSGLVNFAFVLLGVGAGLGRDIIAEKQWTLGNTILLKIIKRKRQIALTILNTLSNHIVARQAVSQYIECLYLISRTMPLLMLENQSCIMELIECLVHINTTTANQLLDALIPLTKVSLNIRDHLIIYLRKTLYSRSVETRQMSVNGFLKLITNLKISNMAVLSQNSMGSFSSGHSVFTQLSLNKTTQNTSIGNFSNEALCFEILSILKRCFMQQADVRSQLYEGLYEAVCVNPELGIPVLDMIQFHFNQYIVTDDESLPPINIDKLVALKETQMILEEPLGKLIHTVGLISLKVTEQEEVEDNNTVTKFTDILNSLSKRMSNCELVHFDLDDGTDLLDIIPESQKKILILKEVMCVYEALIGYNIYSWNNNSQKQGNIINNLFQGYTRLLHFSKSLSKPKKAESKRKKTDQDKTTQHSQKDGKKLNKNIKMPDTIWNFQTAKKALQLLHEPKLTWTTTSEANVVKTNKELHQHVIHATLYLVQSVKRRKDLETRNKKQYFEHITDVASLLFKRIINRLDEFTDFDGVTAVSAMECFNLILTLVNIQYKSNLKLFLNKVVSGIEDNNAIIDSLSTIVKTYENIFENEDYEISVDLEIKKISLIAVTTLQNLVNHTPTSANDLSTQLLEWLKNFASNNTLTSKNSTAFMHLFLETHMKFKASLTLLENLSESLGDTIGVITEEEHTKESFKIINEATVHNIFLSICNSLKSILEDIDAVVIRLKSENYILNFPGEDDSEKRRENLKAKERGVCCQLCFIVTIMTNLSNLIIPAGNLSEAIFKNIMSLFGSLCTLTKYFISRSSKTSLVFQGARFERLVKLAGKQLAPVIYKFILHLEETQRDSQTTQPKKKSVDATTLKSKVLRETRLIPKVIYEIEQFSKCIIQLSNKTKVDLSKYVGQGIVRDFRIIHLKETLDNEGGEVDDSHVSETSNNESRSESIVDINETDVNPRSQETSDEDENPPAKKSKR